ncbi:MAG: helix-turn-helix transcriptional regulator [Oscillospiraceae bacterium]|nr:helix-turn-helix transcriptional regulator [Oscillospiraceae bacterium]
MAYSYKGLWKLLIDKNMMRKDLMELTDINATTLAKMTKELPVRMEILGRICEALNCNIGDIVDYIPNNQEEKDNG